MENTRFKISQYAFLGAIHRDVLSLRYGDGWPSESEDWTNIEVKILIAFNPTTTIVLEFVGIHFIVMAYFSTRIVRIRLHIRSTDAVKAITEGSVTTCVINQLLKLFLAWQHPGAKVQQKNRTHKGTDKWSDAIRQIVG